MPASRAAPTGAVRDAPREGLGQTRAEGPGGAGGGGRPKTGAAAGHLRTDGTSFGPLGEADRPTGPVRAASF